jgi:NAD(P)-dependent dehydrogenase (short-subunit alcohol dehydrogenase family)
MEVPMAAALAGKVAVVAGATRGAGRGIARMLGEAGATVYCTGRSSRTQPNTSKHHAAGRPETIEETAEMVDAAGGRGIAVRVDHTVEAEIVALFERVQKESRRLDVLANVITGLSVESWAPFWKQPVAEGRAIVDSWVWPHVMTCRYSLPLMVARKSGLVVEIVEQDAIAYHGTFYFDMFETALKRLAFAIAEEGGAKGISAVAITPGFLRTESILEKFGVTEANWREAAEKNAEAKKFAFKDSETPCFVGRAVAALAADPAVRRWSGGVYTAIGLSREYGFTDLDGRQPDIWPAAAEAAAAFAHTPGAAVEWALTRRAQMRP